MVISMFKPEAEVWWTPLALSDETVVPGFSADYPTVKCNARDVCQMTTGIGHTSAATSVMALIFSGRFDLTRTYFLVAGIAGIDPNVGTIGSATWPRYMVDFGLQHEIDAREMPTGWSSGYFGIHAANPDAKPAGADGAEVFRLNEDLLQWALSLSKDVKLDDTDTAKAYRSRYRQGPAQAPPAVIQCDTAGGDTYWHGTLIAERAEKWTALLTDGKGRYCTTQQEGTAMYGALIRGASAGRVDLNRLAVLRTGSDFDRQYAGQSAYDSLKAKSIGHPSALNNLVIAGSPLIQEIVTNWDRWKIGVPARP